MTTATNDVKKKKRKKQSQVLAPLTRIGTFLKPHILYPDWRWQRPEPLCDEVSSGCCFGGRFHWFRVKVKYVVSKISGLEWTGPNNQNNNSASASCFLYVVFVVTVRLRRSIKMPNFTFYGGRKSAESDVTRRKDNNLRRFSVGHSITTLLQPCLK